MIRPSQTDWKTPVRRIGNGILAAPLAFMAAGIVWRLSVWRVINRTLGFAAFFLTFVVFSVVFYALFAWIWNRPAEIAKRVPTGSKELRRKRQDFFDNLPK